tara:strand:- start:101 stop:589 length:489 start_codon:yes stop_codon:yes gene_type:complete
MAEVPGNRERDVIARVNEMADFIGVPQVDPGCDEYYARSNALMSMLGTPLGQLPNEDTDDHTPLTRAEQIARIKIMCEEMLSNLDTMRAGLGTHVSVMAGIVHGLEHNPEASAAFALPLVEEANGVLKTAMMHWAAGVASLQTARTRMTTIRREIEESMADV